MTLLLAIKDKNKAGIISMQDCEKHAQKDGTFSFFKSTKHKVVGFTDVEDLTEFTMPTGCSHTTSLLHRHVRDQETHSVSEYCDKALTGFKVVFSVEEFNDIVMGHVDEPKEETVTVGDTNE